MLRLSERPIQGALISPILVFLLASVALGEAFNPLNFPRRQVFVSRPSSKPFWRKMMSGSVETSKDTTAINSSETPNWRVIPAQVEDYGPHLDERPVWSKSQFHESLELYQHFIECTDSYVSPGIKAALNTLDHAYRLYGPKSVICSFNGGKDAVVIMQLVRAAHAKYFNDTAASTSVSHEDLLMVRPRVVYFDHQDEFPEVMEFLRQSVDDFDLDMLAFEKGVKFSDGLKILVKNNILQGSVTSFPMAFVLGTRSSDPNAVGQEYFAPSSHWMPPFMRVNPILNWDYGHVWHFLRLFQLPYCSLYDQGYTSLGTTKDTVPCPALAVNTGGVDENSCVPKFWPAYMLRDWDQERAGRIKKNAAPPPKSPRNIERNSSGAASESSMSIGAQLETRSADVSSLDGTDSTEGSKTATGGDDSTVFSLRPEYPTEQKSVGLLVIGDEILKGLTLDQNTNAAAQAFRKECVKLSRVVVISDCQEEIVKEIRRLQKEVDVIITSGGVGPTHDDVTIKSVAASLDRELVFHEEMAALLKSKMKNATDESLTPAQIKMATLPSNAKLRYLSQEEGDWPILQCRNIFILPGVPEFFSKKITNVAAYLSSQFERGVAYKVVLGVDEASIVDVLNEAVKKHPHVSFGSYPFVNHPDYKTVLTLEGNLVEEDYTPPFTPNNSAVDSSTTDFANSQPSRNSAFFSRKSQFLSKDIRDRYARLALDDLITQLPEGSILRVDNDDLTPFT